MTIDRDFFPHYLRILRERRGLTVEEVASAIGKSQRYVYKLESGELPVPNVLMEPLAQCLGAGIKAMVSCQRSIALPPGLTGQFLDQLNACNHSNPEEVSRLRSEVRIRCGIELANERHLSFDTVADAAALFRVPASTWYGWENGHILPSSKSMKRLLDEPYFLLTYVAAWWPWPDEFNTEVPGGLSYTFIQATSGYKKIQFSKRPTGLKYSTVQKNPKVTESVLEDYLCAEYWLVSDIQILGMKDVCEFIIGLREDEGKDAPHRMPIGERAAMFDHYDTKEIDDHFSELTELTHQELRLKLRVFESILEARQRSRNELRIRLLGLPRERLIETVDRVMLMDPQTSHDALASLGTKILESPSLNLDALQQIVGGDVDDLRKFLTETIRQYSP